MLVLAQVAKLRLAMRLGTSRGGSSWKNSNVVASTSAISRLVKVPETAVDVAMFIGGSGIASRGINGIVG